MLRKVESTFQVVEKEDKQEQNEDKLHQQVLCCKTENILGFKMFQWLNVILPVNYFSKIQKIIHC